MYYGFFSAQSAALYGYDTWSTPDGRTVQVTAICESPYYPGYLWPDKIALGQIIDRLDRFPTQEWLELNRWPRLLEQDDL